MRKDDRGTITEVGIGSARNGSGRTTRTKAQVAASEAFGIELGAKRRAQLEAMGVDELGALRRELKATRR